MSMIKIGMIGIAAVFLALLLKKEKGELALLVGIAASVLIFGYTLSRISFILDFLRELMDTLPVDPALLKALLKMLGITYVADFSASVCREAGYGSVAGQIELFAKLSIVALSIPELWVLLRLIEQMIGGVEMKKIAKILFWSVLFVWMIFLQPQNVMAAEADEIIKELDFTDINAQTQDLPEKMDFEKMVNKLVTEGTGGLDAGMICEYIADLFFYEITAAKPMFLQMFAIGLLFALYGKVMMTRQGYVSQMSFFIVYLGVVLLLLQSFALISEVVDQGIDRLVAFMTAFVPLYAATLFCSGNAASAGSFYQLAFGLMYLLELGMKFIFLPGVHVFVLLLLMDNLFEETKLGKMAQLFEDGIRLVLKGGLTAVMGIGVVQSLIVPARDRLSTNSIFNSISAVPGVGNTFGSAAEILLGSGILIKNSIGAAALILLLVIGMTPLLKSFCFSVMYRLTAAFLAPVADSRIAQCVQAAARGCALFCTIQLDALLLFFITTSIISVSTSFIY